MQDNFQERIERIKDAKKRGILDDTQYQRQIASINKEKAEYRKKQETQKAKQKAAKGKAVQNAEKLMHLSLGARNNVLSPKTMPKTERQIERENENNKTAREGAAKYKEKHQHDGEIELFSDALIKDSFSQPAVGVHNGHVTTPHILKQESPHSTTNLSEGKPVLTKKTVDKEDQTKQAETTVSSHSVEAKPSVSPTSEESTAKRESQTSSTVQTPKKAINNVKPISTSEVSSQAVEEKTPVLPKRRKRRIKAAASLPESNSPKDASHLNDVSNDHATVQNAEEANTDEPKRLKRGKRRIHTAAPIASEKAAPEKNVQIIDTDETDIIEEASEVSEMHAAGEDKANVHVQDQLDAAPARLKRRIHKAKPIQTPIQDQDLSEETPDIPKKNTDETNDQELTSIEELKKAVDFLESVPSQPKTPQASNIQVMHTDEALEAAEPEQTHTETSATEILKPAITEDAPNIPSFEVNDTDQEQDVSNFEDAYTSAAEEEQALIEKPQKAAADIQPKTGMQEDSANSNVDSTPIQDVASEETLEIPQKDNNLYHSTVSNIKQRIQQYGEEKSRVEEMELRRLYFKRKQSGDKDWWDAVEIYKDYIKNYDGYYDDVLPDDAGEEDTDHRGIKIKERKQLVVIIGALVFMIGLFIFMFI